MTRLNGLFSGAALLGLILVFTSLVAAQDDATPPDETSAPAVTVVDMVFTDFLLNPSSVAVPAGPVSFAIVNRGVIDHNLAIENGQRQIIAASTSVPSGRTGVFDLTLAPGSYTMVCTLPAHREAGMVGAITVTP